MQRISDEYLEMQKELHTNPNYGVASIVFAPLVADLISKARIATLSDYGAGKQNLHRALLERGVCLESYFPYDPAFPDYGAPRPSDLVCCIDVLEHVEEAYLDNVLKDLSSITVKLGFFSVHMGPAVKTLGDGRNAHLIQRPASWWLPRFSRYFEVIQLQEHNLMGKGFWVVVKPGGCA